MNQPADQEVRKSRKPWTKPEMRKIKLTEEEMAALRASDDPMALLFKMKPQLGRSRQG